MTEVMKENLVQQWYDRNARDREFVIGDQVIISCTTIMNFFMLAENYYFS